MTTKEKIDITKIFILFGILVAVIKFGYLGLSTAVVFKEKTDQMYETVQAHSQAFNKMQSDMLEMKNDIKGIDFKEDKNCAIIMTILKTDKNCK